MCPSRGSACMPWPTAWAGTGAMASAMAIEGLAQLQNAEPGEQTIRACFSAINQAIHDRQEAEEALQGMAPRSHCCGNR